MTMNENDKQAEPVGSCGHESCDCRGYCQKLQANPAEPVAWRPILQHPIPWVTGKPQESDIRHWTSQDCEIEYAYTHPPQPVQPADTPEEFNAQSFFSLWSSYCDKKMETEDLKAINEHLLEALKHAQKVLNHNNLALDCVPVNAAIAAAKAQIKEQSK